MSEIKDITKTNKKQYHHLTKEQRAQIEILLSVKDKNGKRQFNNTYISKAKYKLEKYPKMKKYIEDKILIDKWAPDVIIGYMKKHKIFERDGFCEITMQTIYNAIRYNIINVKIENMRRMKYDPKYEYHDDNQLPESKKDYSIEKRPEEVDKHLVLAILNLIQ